MVLAASGGSRAACEPELQGQQPAGIPVSSAPSFSDVYDFENLYRAHLAARKGKRDRCEVADFELNLGMNLVELSDNLKDGSYRVGPYVRFVVRDPKRREVHALHYRDRVVQHSLCDNVVAPLIEPRLIFDNCACRAGKGTDFALDRLEKFLREHCRVYGPDGWSLRIDVRHFFASVPHGLLKRQLARVPFDRRTHRFLEYIIDTYEDSAGSGLPLGNQTSQWFALYYLDPVDRLIKERMHVRGYVRYMDDLVLIHHDRGCLAGCLESIRVAMADLGLELNGKTQIAPLSQGIDFLGWHAHLTPTGAVKWWLRQKSKRRMFRGARAAAGLDPVASDARLVSYLAHLDGRGGPGIHRAVRMHMSRGRAPFCV